MGSGDETKDSISAASAATWPSLTDVCQPLITQITLTSIQLGSLKWFGFLLKISSFPNSTPLSGKL